MAIYDPNRPPAPPVPVNVNRLQPGDRLDYDGHLWTVDFLHDRQSYPSQEIGDPVVNVPAVMLSRASGYGRRTCRSVDLSALLTTTTHPNA